MSRADFLAKVEQLLGKFDSESYIRGFTAGFDRALHLVSGWVDVMTPPSGAINSGSIQKQIKVFKKRRK
jgi:hypothetical protein